MAVISSDSSKACFRVAIHRISRHELGLTFEVIPEAAEEVKRNSEPMGGLRSKAPNLCAPIIRHQLSPQNSQSSLPKTPNSFTMTPTPVRETLQHPGRLAFPPIRGFRFDADRRNVTPTLHTPVTPLVDEGAEGDEDSDEGSIEPRENDEIDEEGESELGGGRSRR
jgi:hypothetical protein